MAAITEWFGIYNMIFRYMKNKFGEKELMKYIGDTAQKVYDDLSEEFKANGISGIKGYYGRNFIEDGGNVNIVSDGNTLVFQIAQCPAYQYMLNSENPYDKPEPYFCNCCIEINTIIVKNSGCMLTVTDCDCKGKCKWSVKENKGG